jgi:hypothetical protein
MYSFNYDYIGSRATSNDAGCYPVAVPNWNGATPAGIGGEPGKKFNFKRPWPRT